jgi:hypothetical protein
MPSTTFQLSLSYPDFSQHRITDLFRSLGRSTTTGLTAERGRNYRAGITAVSSEGSDEL